MPFVREKYRPNDRSSSSSHRIFEMTSLRSSTLFLAELTVWYIKVATRYVSLKRVMIPTDSENGSVMIIVGKSRTMKILLQFLSHSGVHLNDPSRDAYARPTTSRNQSGRRIVS